jgi:serine/threonine protein kinase
VTGTRADLQAQLAPEFEILRPLGEGSTGSVHLARESALRRLVAIKIPRADVARDTVGRQRFEREARAAARLQHPSACAIHRIGHLPDGTPYLVMEYVKGRTLDDLLAAEGACSEATGTRIIAQVASALAAAHEQGVLHRDVRPNNVIWDAAAGRAVLTDFGLAVALLCPLTGRLRHRRCHARRRLLRTTARFRNVGCAAGRCAAQWPATASSAWCEPTPGRSSSCAASLAVTAAAHSMQGPVRCWRTILPCSRSARPALVGDHATATPSRLSRSVLYDEGDVAGRALAERIVALAGRPSRRRLAHGHDEEDVRGAALIFVGEIDLGQSEMEHSC